MKKIVLITESSCDFTDILGSCEGIELHTFGFDEAPGTLLPQYDAAVILWNSRTGALPAGWDARYRDIAKSGTRVFSNVVPGMPGFHAGVPESTRFNRLVFTGGGHELPGIETGDILEDQDNVRVPYESASADIPILAYGGNMISHYRRKSDPGAGQDLLNRALWFETPSLLLCSFDISDFLKARFSPAAKWRAVVGFILDWITEGSVCPTIKHSYSPPINGFSPSPEKSFLSAMNWFDDAGILADEGRQGVYEGYATEISSGGTQKKAVVVRNDCCGEAMLAYYMKYFLYGDCRAKDISENLSRFIFDNLRINDRSDILYGMMRWSSESPGICYQDDVARSLIPHMLRCLYSGSDLYLQECTDSLQFLVKTTGPNGLRVIRTENGRLDEAEIKRLSETPVDFPSAHYTAHYLGALLLNYKLTGNRIFLDMGTRGLESIMAAYPDTKRVLSETQEMCRLVLPLAFLFWATGEERHKDMLYRVCGDLQAYRHPSGAYLEWDTGYKAKYSRTSGDESSILTENGDPVTDLLYSVNWLPVGFIQAYFVTGDKYFHELWLDITRFLMSCQLRSEYPAVNGAWARAWDVELDEVFALPNDVGWGPWCIESGWTVAEIASGIAMGLKADEIKKLY